MTHRGGCHCGAIAFEVDTDGAFGADQKGNAMAAINVRCLDDVDLATIERTPFDGRRL